MAAPTLSVLRHLMGSVCCGAVGFALCPSCSVCLLVRLFVCVFVGDCGDLAYNPYY